MHCLALFRGFLAVNESLKYGILPLLHWKFKQNPNSFDEITPLFRIKIYPLFFHSGLPTWKKLCQRGNNCKFYFLACTVVGLCEHKFNPTWYCLLVELNNFVPFLQRPKLLVFHIILSAHVVGCTLSYSIWRKAKFSFCLSCFSFSFNSLWAAKMKKIAWEKLGNKNWRLITLTHIAHVP